MKSGDMRIAALLRGCVHRRSAPGAPELPAVRLDQRATESWLARCGGMPPPV
jgi:hypothetical protein